MLVGVHHYVFEDAVVLLAFHSDEDPFEAVNGITFFSSHSFPWEDDVDFIFFFTRNPSDDSGTKPCLFQFVYPVAGLSGFCLDDGFVLVEDSFPEELSAGCLHCHFRIVILHQLRDVTMIDVLVQQSRPTSHCL